MYSAYIVDDEKLVLDDLILSVPWLEHGFALAGFSVDAQIALAEITEIKPDVVFADLKMPVYSGIELIRRVRAQGMDTEFIMLSAFDEFDACRSFYRMSGFDYILKPLDQPGAALVLEQLGRKLAGKRCQTPSVQFVPSQSQGFDKLVAYIMETFNQKHTLEALSKRFSLNPTYICDLFASHYQSTLVIFVTNLRMREASRLMLETDQPLKEISIHCGYPNYQYFCRVFRQHFGKSPAGYRESAG